LFIERFKRPVILASVIGFIYFIIYIALRIYCNIYPPMYTRYRISPEVTFFYTYFNVTISFCGVIFFNILHAIEYSYIKNKLLSENSKLDNYATFYPLTNLLNRRSTDEKLKQLFDAHYHDEDAFSIIMCDIDKFKSVNDTYGHDAGDFVLKEVAWILKDTVRDGDVVSRWGGEEFLIIVNSHKANAAILAERIRAQVEAHKYNYKNTELHITITLGVSSYHANTDIKSLIKSADQKLYRGKENGRNQVVA
ncbi:MAG: GGDEF domain-containing protein, partial [Lachnospiraceae bacterium]|nr:GGDEF domain-containing protein [Lachnospiraceae bacterium]